MFYRFLFFFLFICSFPVFSQKTKADSFRVKADWFSKARYGIMVHYLHGLQNGSPPWNQGKKTSWDVCVNSFDVQKFANDVKATGAGYVVFSLQQSDEYFCAPNSTFEKITGLKRGFSTSTRDLIAELYTALKAKNINLMIYITGNGPFKHWKAMERLTNNNFHERVVNNAYQVDKVFVQNWGKVLSEFSKRYKSKVKGWWIDGAYPFIGYNETLLPILKTALKSGNSNAIVAFNPAPKDTVTYYSKWDDYTAGEMYHINSVPKTRFMRGVQWHAATFVGKDWANPGLRFSDKELSDYISKCNQNGGVVSLDVCVLRDGSIDMQQIGQLKKVKGLLKY